MMLANKGDLLPVSAFPVDGTWPVGTARFEKRNIADEIPEWETSLCIQCNKCVMVCPHSAIRAKAVQPDALADAPASLKSMPYKGPEVKGSTYLLQVAPEDCTGCTLCVQICPGKDKADETRLALTMVSKTPLLEAEKTNFSYFLGLPDIDKSTLRITPKTTQLITPLFEFSGACLGCGETPYIKTITQLFGDRAVIANATGCSSIFGGNLPTTPYTTDCEGRGPAWANSLFEDNAEFGLGFRLALDHHQTHAKELLKKLQVDLPEVLVNELLHNPQNTDAAIKTQREKIEVLRTLLNKDGNADHERLDELADYLVNKSVWIVGGDGWAYDIGYGGLDHVLASGRNVNILVLDTEVYSNTGGQASKSTPLGATAKFAMAGKTRPKKDLGLIAMAYGNVYVASVAFGAKDGQMLKALQEAASYDGVSLVIAYAHCIAHGYEMSNSLEQQKTAVSSGYWPLYRYDPRRLGTNEAPLELDVDETTSDLGDFMASETRFRITDQRDHEQYSAMVTNAAEWIARRMDILKRMAGSTPSE